MINELTPETFLKALTSVRKINRYKNEFILKAGYSLQNAIYVLFHEVWKNENVPDKWYNSELIQLEKGKTPKNSLENFCFMHIEHLIVKLFQQIVYLETKDLLINNMTKFQIASRPGHRAIEHVFCVMSLIQLKEKEGNAVYLSLFDLQKYFDRESIFDCQYEVYKSAVRGKMYRLMFLMNENTRIKVRTPVGLTDSDDVGPTPDARTGNRNRGNYQRSKS